MDLGSVLLVLAIIVALAAYIGRPLVRGQALALRSPDHDLSALLAERDRILSTLQELDMDSAVGKLEPADYEAQRAGLVERGAAVLRQIDQRTGRPDQVDPSEIDPLNAQIEAEVARMRQLLSDSPVAGASCPNCGGQIRRSDSFCTHCGEALTAASAHA